jgi:antitoxin component YwqK of YwqJK toxin-antitoxin module
MMKKIILAVILISSFSFCSEKTSMAVYAFDANGVTMELANSVADFIQDGLQNTGRFNLIERQKVQTILKEQAFQKSGCTSTDCAVEVGRILNVSHIITGSVSRLQKKYIISMKLVDVEASKISITDEVECDSEDLLINASKKLAEHFSKGVSVSGKVLKVMNENEIVVNIGMQDGIDTGTVLDVIRLGDSIKDDSGKVVYQEKKNIAKIKITVPMEEASKASIIETYEQKTVQAGDVVIIKREALKPLDPVLKKAIEVIRKTIEVFENGNPKERVFYCEGKEVARKTYDENGESTEVTGTIPDGVVKEYYQDGKLVIELTYKDNKGNGPSKEYYESGKIKRECSYVDNNLDGPIKDYYENGQLAADGYVKTGKQEGILTRYYENGIIQSIVNWKDGKQDGLARIYYEDGNLKVEGNWQYGVELNYTNYDDR